MERGIVISLLIFFLLSFLIRSSAPTSGALTDNLIGFWNLDESGTGTRADSVDGNDLANPWGATQTTGPGSHNATNFVAASRQCLNHGDNAPLSLGDVDFTIAAWVKFTTLNLGVVAAKMNWSATREWMIQQSTQFRFMMSQDGSTENSQYATTFGTLTTGVWYFVVAQHDAVNNFMKLSVNAGTIDSASYSSGMYDSASSLWVGCYADGANFLDGAVAMLGIWTRLLSADEITTLYNSGNGMNYSEILAAGAETVALRSP